MYSDQQRVTNIINKSRTPFVLRMFVFVCFLIVSFSITNVAKAQITSAVNTSESIDLKIANLEQNYDSQLIQILSNYFDKKMFFVDVSVKAEMVNETYATSESKINRERPKNIIMPGLPFLPEGSMREQQAADKVPEVIVNQNVFRTLQLKNLNVNIYADSSFSAPEIEFMKLIAGFAIKTDPTRGDIINISRVSIPDFSREKPTPIVIEEPVEEPSVSVQPTTLLSVLSKYKLPLIVAGIIVLLLILFVFLWKFFTKDKKEPRDSRESFRSDTSFDASTPATNNQHLAPRSTTDANGNFTVDVDGLVSQFFNSPQEIALLFEFWIDTDNKEGVQKSAQVIASIDKQLIRSLKKDMQPANYVAISEAIDALPELSTDRKQQVLKDFDAVLRPSGTDAQTDHKHAKLGLFKFLSHISDDQIINLMKTEDTQTAALVLDYLPGNKAAELLEKFDSDRATHIMINMATIHTLSYKYHTETSAKLFDKAMDLLESEKEERLGAENILPILERIPLKDQKRYIQQLIDTGSPVGNIIKKQFITIDEVPELDDAVINAAVNHLSTELLLSALVGLDDAIINKVLSVRPKREQRLIRIELDQADLDDEQNIERAKVLLMNSIRNEAKKQSHIKK